MKKYFVIALILAALAACGTNKAEEPLGSADAPEQNTPVAAGID